MKVIKTIDGLLLYFDSDVWDFIFHTYGYKVSRSSNGRLNVQVSKGAHRGKILARFIVSCPDGLFVDHINGNTLDNRLCNLRIVTTQQNNFNTKKYINAKENLPKGVRRSGLVYKAYITVNSARYYLGTFSTVHEADAAYKKAADNLFGEYAYHNSRNR